jgi:hypothetical protein
VRKKRSQRETNTKTIFSSIIPKSHITMRLSIIALAIVAAIAAPALAGA